MIYELRSGGKISKSSKRLLRNFIILIFDSGWLCAISVKDLVSAANPKSSEPNKVSSVIDLIIGSIECVPNLTRILGISS